MGSWGIERKGKEERRRKTKIGWENGERREEKRREEERKEGRKGREGHKCVSAAGCIKKDTILNIRKYHLFISTFVSEQSRL